MQKLPTSRTRFGRDIIAEFVQPVRPSNKVIIFTPGCPGYAGGKDEAMSYYVNRGYWVILPRYRGTWESGGTFLEYPPSDDALIIMDELSVGFRDLWSGADHVVKEPEVYLIGGSFGGPAAILASRDPRVKKVVSISAVVDWKEQRHTAEPLDLMSVYVPAAFGAAYRGDPSVWHMLAEGNFYNPIAEKDSIDGTKLLMIHGKGDRVVHAAPGEAFAKDVGAKFVMLATDEHMGVSSSARPALAKHIEKHFRVR